MMRLKFYFAHICKFTLWVSLSFLIVSQSWGAAQQCQDIFAASNLAQRLQSVAKHLSQHALPLDMTTQIQNHPLMDLGRALDGGRGLVFGFRFYDQIITDSFKGEWTQTQFVVKILKTAFPNAQFVSAHDQADLQKSFASAKARLYFYIADPAEFHTRLDSSLYLTMPLLKAANGSTSTLARNEARSLFQFSDEQRAASLYMYGGLSKPHLYTPDFVQVSRELIRLGYQTIFISDSVISTPSAHLYVEQNFPQARAIFDQVLYLSQIKASDLPIGTRKKTLIVNDQSGLMPILHAASDIAYVQGPINPFEALNSGVGTVILANRFSLDGYDQKTYEQMLTYASATGHAQVIETLWGFKKATQRIQKSAARPWLRPDQVKLGAPTPFEQLLADLERKIKLQIQ